MNDMNIRNIQIISGEVNLHGILSLPDDSVGVRIMFLHGGGHSSAERYGKVQEFFSDHGITSLAFSFRGCGTSEGDFSKSSLSDRLVDAESSLSAFKLATGLVDNQIFVWGSSMGGHVACRLIAQHPQVRGLILNSAAAYGQKAESQPFGPIFTESINEENSWNNSLAFTDLASFQNHILVMYGEGDKVIPDQVKNQYKLSSKYPEYHVIPGYGHPMLRPITKVEKNAWDTMVNLGLNFILGK
jgi:hypothetical protein